ncbi:hypothetical protein EsH8_IX_000201 [Colletotrichum jinshuiense]
MHTIQFTLALFSQALITAAVPINPTRAVPIETRLISDLNTILDALAPVSDSLTALDVAIRSLDGGAGAANNLLTVVQQAQGAADQATVTVQSARQLTGVEANKLRRTTDDIIDQTGATFGDLASRKSTLDGLGFSGITLQALQRSKSSSLSLTSALENKVPKTKLRTAEESRLRVESIFDQTISVYSAPPAVPAAAIPAAPPAAAIPVAAPPAAAPPAAAPTGFVPMPGTAPPPQVAAPPAGRKDRKKKKSKGRIHDVEVEGADDQEENADDQEENADDQEEEADTQADEQ